MKFQHTENVNGFTCIISADELDENNITPYDIGNRSNKLTEFVKSIIIEAEHRFDDLNLKEKPLGISFYVHNGDAILSVVEQSDLSESTVIEALKRKLTEIMTAGAMPQDTDREDDCDDNNDIYDCSQRTENLPILMPYHSMNELLSIVPEIKHLMHDFERMLRTQKGLDIRQTSALYKYDNMYYLSLQTGDIPLPCLLEEFGEIIPDVADIVRIMEHGEPIIKDMALEKLSS
jgi:negative regulator of genetic competence, sporulation and motility